jgi:hypothetical protein
VKKAQKKSMFLPLAVCGLAVVGGLFAYAKMSGNVVPESERRTERLPEHQDKSGKAPIVETSENAPADRTVEVVTPKFNDKGDLSFDRTKKDVPKGEDAYLVAFNATLREVKAVPDNAFASNAKLDGSTLTVNFTPEFEKSYGTDDENALLNSLLATAKQFKGVKKLQILVDSKPIETLGSVEITAPLDVE